MSVSGLVLLVSLFIFFSVEQSLIAGNLAASRAALAQNNAIRSSNERLEQAKSELQDEEDECVPTSAATWRAPVTSRARRGQARAQHVRARSLADDAAAAAR